MNDTSYGLSGKSFSDPFPLTAKLREQTGKWKPDTYMAFLLPILLPLTPSKRILAQLFQQSSDRDYAQMESFSCTMWRHLPVTNYSF